jgi:hypothetical protein
MDLSCSGASTSQNLWSLDFLSPMDFNSQDFVDLCQINYPEDNLQANSHQVTTVSYVLHVTTQHLI